MQPLKQLSDSPTLSHSPGIDSAEHWIGESPALKKTRNIIQRLSRSTLPILINGPSGTGKVIAAKQIHDQSGNPQTPFIDIQCELYQTKRLDYTAVELLTMAKGGSLYLKNIDKLNTYDLSIIKDFWLKSDNGIRLIASIRSQLQPYLTSNDILYPVKESSTQWFNFHSLPIELPALINRREDIRALVSRTASSSTTDHKPNVSTNRIAALFSQCAWYCLENFDWPGNVKQLTRCIEKLLFLSPHMEVTADILKLHFPMMSKTNHTRPQPQEHHSTLDSKDNTKNVVALRKEKLNTRREQNNDEHHYKPSMKDLPIDVPISVSKAFYFIRNNFTDKITMADVADIACISEPHLSFLLKKHLGQSFKQLLIEKRIEYAIQLLTHSPDRQVTLICNDAGFSDLSHFEKTFKRMVGVSPGRYRKERAQSCSSANL